MALGLTLAGCAIDPSPTPLPDPIRLPQQQEAYDDNLKAGSVRDQANTQNRHFK